MNTSDEATLHALERLSELHCLTPHGEQWLLNLRTNAELDAMPVASAWTGGYDSEGNAIEVPVTGEADPHGTSQHAPGAKLDAGKVRPSLIFNDMPRALLAVAEVATFGANKYSDGGWQHVPDALKRYTDAMDRHRLKEFTECRYDHDSELTHAAHLAWNALARLELLLRDEEALK